MGRLEFLILCLWRLAVSLQCCGPARPFEMKIVDNMDHEVIHLNRPLACSSCCFPCCLQVCFFFFALFSRCRQESVAFFPDLRAGSTTILQSAVVGGDVAARYGDRQHRTRVEHLQAQVRHQERGRRARPVHRGPLLHLQLRQRRRVPRA